MIWDYWYVPGLYTYLRTTTPEMVVEDELGETLPVAKVVREVMSSVQRPCGTRTG
jgi:hypothetical protein